MYTCIYNKSYKYIITYGDRGVNRRKIKGGGRTMWGLGSCRSTTSRITTCRTLSSNDAGSSSVGKEVRWRRKVKCDKVSGQHDLLQLSLKLATLTSRKACSDVLPARDILLDQFTEPAGGKLALNDVILNS